ncbi:MAG: hypothetical protein MZV64_09550 [Ignavibacteriales bacterium]|nr:hypothetical protein [Ignavibacteriales bacterium]
MNTWDGVEWFRAEGFDLFAPVSALAALFAPGGGTYKPREAAAAKLYSDFRKMEAKSGYKVDGGLQLQGVTMPFESVDLENLSDNPWKLIGKDWMLVTAGNLASWNTMTASWGGLGVLWHQNVAFVFVRPSRHTFEFMNPGRPFHPLLFPRGAAGDPYQVRERLGEGRGQGGPHGPRPVRARTGDRLLPPGPARPFLPQALRPGPGPRPYRGPRCPEELRQRGLAPDVRRQGGGMLGGSGRWTVNGNVRQNTLNHTTRLTIRGIRAEASPRFTVRCPPFTSL